MDENQHQVKLGSNQRRRGAVDRTNNVLQSGFGTYQNARRVIFLVGRLGAFAALPGWMFLAVGLLVLFFFTFFIVSFAPGAPGAPGTPVTPSPGQPPIISAAPTSPPGETGIPLPPVATETPVPSVGDIASCQFIRSDQTPKSASFKSFKLLQYFTEASLLSGIPASILAGIARIESPEIVNYTDTTLSSFGCPKSPTGALGLMQIQPPGTKGYFADGVRFGASYLGKTIDQINYCDTRESIIVSSGFIIKKLQLGFDIGNGDKWDPQWTNDRNIINKVAQGYYGCLEYGGADKLKCEGPYNYGDDLWNSVRNCKITSSG